MKNRNFSAAFRLYDLYNLTECQTSIYASLSLMAAVRLTCAMDPDKVSLLEFQKYSVKIFL